MMLEDKVAVMYGAGGAIGSAVARAFAREGARLFLTGRHLARVEGVAKELGSAEAAEVDALDEQAVDEHLQSVTEKAGRVDVSFNAVGVADAEILGVPLVELDADRFSRPITTYATSYFLTARLAARRMVAQRSGVIMTVTGLHSRTGVPLVGGTVRRWRRRRRSREPSPPSSHLWAYAWSACDHRPCRRQARSKRPSRSAPRPWG